MNHGWNEHCREIGSAAHEARGGEGHKRREGGEEPMKKIEVWMGGGAWH